VGAGRETARGRTEPDRAGHGVGRAYPLPRRTAVADAHVRAEFFGAELRGSASQIGRMGQGRGPTL